MCRRFEDEAAIVFPFDCLLGSGVLNEAQPFAGHKCFAEGCAESSECEISDACGRDGTAAVPGSASQVGGFAGWAGRVSRVSRQGGSGRAGPGGTGSVYGT
ncbi:hypothetical protein GCM10009647_025750 [Streptomyces sanglieri]